MGKFRSRSGCLTCRTRRVKCDETHPICKACEKKGRTCQWEPNHTKFKDYQPRRSASNSPREREKTPGLTGVEGRERNEESDSRPISPRRNNHQSGKHLEGPSHSAPSVSMLSNSSSVSIDQSPFVLEHFIHDTRASDTGEKRSRDVPVANILPKHVPEGMPLSIRASLTTPIALTRHEALLIHHYTEHLGRWLDCTDASRQFTLGVPEKALLCPVLCYAVLSFAACHLGDAEAADFAYQQCIALLIDRLNEDSARHDEALLCAIVILQCYEQLNVSSSTGADNGQHLAGCSAIFHTFQGHHVVDPSAPTLREAAFWVYVRQCLYTATINQQPPDINFSMQLNPKPNSMHDSHPLARLKLETAWANQMVWLTACVVHFCFETVDLCADRAFRLQQWQELWDLVHAWISQRPKAFNAIFEERTSSSSIFREIWFTADWHAISFISYHFSCIMLLSYKPGPRFAIRNVDSLSIIDCQILNHGGAIFGASKSSPETVSSSVMLCHTLFLWAPLVTERKEQEEILSLLYNLEKTNLWPTAWIISVIKIQWGMD